ncbi:MAG: TRAP transporter small permease subunit [Thermodesulfobacteriota bacterium]|nr:TRAP transporter small permease subunit [Thermodesulfobacteriota bacterium]
MDKFLKTIDRINENIGKAVSYLILFLVGVILYEIFVRYLLNNPTIWAHETSQMIYGAYVILLGGYVLQRGGHVNVDILFNRFKPRTRAIINLFTWLLFFYFCGMLFLKGGEMAWDSFKLRETEPTTFGPPVYPIKMMIPLGALLILLQGLAKFIRDFNLAITGKEEAP